jgi:hypothetical protein
MVAIYLGTIFTGNEVAKHAQKLGIVEYISYRQVNVFLKSRGFKTA